MKRNPTSISLSSIGPARSLMAGVVRHTCLMAAALGLAGTAAGSAQAEDQAHGTSARQMATAARAWRVDYWARSAGVHLISIAAPGKRDAWAVGTRLNARHRQRPMVLHWNGVRWAPYAVPSMRPNCTPTWVTATSASNVWIFCFQPVGDVIHSWNGTSWRTLPAPVGLGMIFNAVVLSSARAWVAGVESCDANSCRTVIWQWNGVTWSSHPVNAQLPVFLAGAGNQVWLIGCKGNTETCRPAAFRWSGTQWRAVPGPYGRLTVDPTIAVSPAGELWIQSLPPHKGHVVLYHWRAGKWHTIVAPIRLEYQSWLTYDGHHGVWSGATAHWTGRRWINAMQVALPDQNQGSMTAFVAPVPGTTSTWGLGNGSPCRTRICPRDFIAAFGTLPAAVRAG